jgi:HemY protein
MKLLLLVLLILVVAVLIGLQISSTPGYVLIATPHWMLETHLWSALLITVFTLIIFYCLVRFIKFFFNLPQHIKSAKEKTKKNKAIKVTYEGLMDLMQANWSDAHEKLMAGSKHSPAPLVNYLGAAFSADRAGRYAERDQLLTQAADDFPKAKLAVCLVKSQLQFEAGEYQNALATLNALQELAPKQQQVLKQRARVLKKLGRWDELVELLPNVRKQKSLRDSEIQHYARLAYQHVFAETTGVEKLKHTWDDAPKFITEQADIICLYVQALMKFNQMNSAEETVRDYLKKNWDTQLVLLYGAIHSDNTKKQFAHAEDWLNQHRHDENLLFILGQLAQRNRLWGKAKDYYRASLAQQPTVAAYTAYAQLLEQLDEQQESLLLYRKGLLLALERNGGAHHD